MDEGALSDVLAAVALQPGGPALLAALAAINDRAGLAIVDAARRLSFNQRGELLSGLRRHRSKRVRDQARRTLLAGSEGRLFPELTPREEEVLGALAEGSTNQEIATELAITLATAKTYVHRILSKMEVNGRLAAAVLYQQRAASSSERPGDAARTLPR
jgi:DNA-binding NarL/FixJ family response regulator